MVRRPVTGLHVADGLVLPADYVTKTAAIIAQRRRGKTYTAAVIAEELVALGIPWTALDPTGAWWGLRSSADGLGPGLPVFVLGGDHGDVPIDRHDGKAVARLVLDSPGWYIIDLSLFDIRAAEREFAADFGETLYRLKARPEHKWPQHIFIDEADMFAPQEKETGDQRMLGAFQSIVRRGGIRGLGTTLITQRPALLNKSVLTQLDLLILLRLVAGNDQDAVDKNYIKRAGTAEQRTALLDSMASLKLGEAWLWEPGEDLFERAQIRERHTFNSSATPKMGEQRIEPRALADVDVAALMSAMAESVARAEADDPRKLRARITELERALGKVENERPEPVIETTEVPVLDPELVGRLTDALERLENAFAIDRQLVDRAEALGSAVTASLEAWTRPRTPARTVQAPKPASAQVTATPRKDTTTDTASTPPKPLPDGLKLGKREKAIMAALAQYPNGRTQRQLALLTGYSAKASTIDAGLSALRKAGYVQGRVATTAGIEWLGDSYDPLPTGPALLAHWQRQLGQRERAILDVLLDVYPDRSTKDAISEQTGYSRDASTIDAGMSKLRGLEIADGWRVSDDFMEAIQ